MNNTPFPEGEGELIKLITDNLTNEEYHALPAIGASGLCLLDRSPAHYYAKYLDPDREKEESTPAQILGKATHCAVLEPELFDDRYTVIPEGLDRRTKEGKAIHAEIIKTGKHPLKFDEMKAVKRMQDAVHKHSITKVLWDLDGDFESSLLWTDEATGVKCKIRPDRMIAPCDAFPNGIVVDLKTTTDASPIGFAKHSWNLKYYMQASFYPDGFMQVMGTSEPPEFLWLAVEKDAPYLTAYYNPPANLIDYGKKESRRLLELFAECKDSGKWPGYGCGISELDMPAWANNVIEG